MKCVTKKRSISFLIIIFLIAGMCFDIPKAESFFEYTDKGKHEIISISDTISQCRDICTDELLRISSGDYSVYKIKCKAKSQNAFFDGIYSGFSL